jgi:predicted nucleic acid-binding Zn ribbon protein
VPDSGTDDVEAALPASSEQLSRAREALAAARAAVQSAHPGLPAQRSAPGPVSRPGAASQAGSESGPDSPQASAASPGPGSRAARRIRRDDPEALGTAIDQLLDAEGWNLAAATGSVFGRWAQIVGADLAGHTQPESLREGELTVIADSTAWATQLRLLAAQLVHRLNAELGPGTVLRVKVRGPVTATRKPGEWRVRGSRGPRDTYG